MNIYLTTLGCRLNEAELESWSSELQQQGCMAVQDPAEAAAIVINTCAVTQEAVRKSRKSIKRLHRENPLAKLIATGCFASLADANDMAALGIDLTIDNASKDVLVSRLLQHLGDTVGTHPEAATHPGISSLFARNRQRAFIKVQDGCRYRCTYCIVTLARGEEKSRPISSIVDQINRLAEQGIKEVVLTGVHVGGYGSDLGENGGTNLHSLVKAILADSDMPRIRFASVEPWDLPPSFFELFKNSRLMPHMHLPMQSGSDSVLRRMSRRCRTGEFLTLAEEIRQQVPGFNITTDIIVGFPGETENEWHQTLDFVERVSFGDIHIFSYSPRSGTKAERLPDPVDRATKRQRSQQLHKLAADHRLAHLLKAQGGPAEVLWESAKPSPLSENRVRYAGYTPSYQRVFTEVDKDVVLENAITCSATLDYDEQTGMLRANHPGTLISPGFDANQITRSARIAAAPPSQAADFEAAGSKPIQWHSRR